MLSGLVLREGINFHDSAPKMLFQERLDPSIARRTICLAREMLKSFVAESGHPIALRQLPVVRFGRTKSNISSPTFRGGWRRDVAEPKNCCLEDYAMFFLIRGIYLTFVFLQAWCFFLGKTGV